MQLVKVSECGAADSGSKKVPISMSMTHYVTVIILLSFIYFQILSEVKIDLSSTPGSFGCSASRQPQLRRSSNHAEAV